VFLTKNLIAVSQRSKLKGELTLMLFVIPVLINPRGKVERNELYTRPVKSAQS